MTAKDFLQQAYIAHREVELKLEEIEKLRSLSTRTTGKISSIPIRGSGNGSRVENAVVLLEEQAERLADEVLKLLEINKSVADAIAKVKNHDERIILEYRYLCFFSWSQISTLMKTGARQIYRLHNQALKNFSTYVI